MDLEGQKGLHLGVLGTSYSPELGATPFNSAPPGPRP